MTSHRSNAGFTLVEMMVALAVGSFLLAGLSSVMFSSKRTYDIQNGLAGVQENGRFVIDELGRTVRMLGFDDPSTAFSPAVPFIAATDAPDTLTVSFEGNAGIPDCLGQPTAAGTHISNTYSLDVANNLICSLSIDGGAAVVETLIPDVESLQFRFGEDTDADEVPNRYVDASDTNNWNNVVTVQIAVLLRTRTEVNQDTDINTYALLNAVVDPVDDRRLRRQFVKTVALRNH